ncbi:MAG: PEP-utilizing enzyme [Acidimicrobiales bacterium]
MVAGDGPGLVFDSVLDPEYPEWTRAHIETVLPDPFTPLGWTLVGPAFERTQQFMPSRRLWVTRKRRSGEWCNVGRIGGYAYINVSTARLLVRRSPGVTLDAADEQMGLAGLVPLSARTWRDRIWYPAALFGVVRTPALLPWDLRRQRRATRNLAVNSSQLASLSTDELVEWIESARRKLVRILLAHYVVRLFTTPAVERLQETCNDDTVALGLLADLDDLASSAPTLALHQLAQDTRTTGQVDPDALSEYTDRFGHRGRSELDPGRPVWADQRDQLEARVTAIADAPATALAGQAGKARAAALTALAELPAGRQRRIRMIAKIARFLSVTGERTKDDLAVSIHAIRLGARLLSARCGIPVEDTAYYSWNELRSTAQGDASSIDVAERRQALQLAAATPVPYYLRTDDPTVELPARPADPVLLTGIGASPGEATGRAVVVNDPFDELPDGEILVAHSTDVAWTHLFLTHDAVVTDVGDLLSHTSIVARDLGIPAVVGTETATTRIATGQIAHVSGTKGTVVLPG